MQTNSLQTLLKQKKHKMERDQGSPPPYGSSESRRIHPNNDLANEIGNLRIRLHNLRGSIRREMNFIRFHRHLTPNRPQNVREPVVAFVEKITSNGRTVFNVSITQYLINCIVLGCILFIFLSVCVAYMLRE